jgi:hypothetical protein
MSNKIMKGILTTAILFFAILNGVQSQTKDTLLHKRPVVKSFGVKPESVTFKGNKVIVVWNRKDWERAKYLQRKRAQRVRKIKSN